jgi:hypothetical protein
MMLCAFFWMIHRPLKVICQRFGTLCLFHLHRRVRMKCDWGWECTYVHVASMWVIALHCLFLYSDLPPPCHPPSDWLRLFFEPKLFPYIYPTFSTPVTLHTYPPMKMEQTQCSEMLAFKLQTPVNHPEESIRHSEHGESLKSRITNDIGRKYYEKSEAIQHTPGAYNALAQGDDTHCHNHVVNIVHTNLLSNVDCQRDHQCCIIYMSHRPLRIAPAISYTMTGL